MTDARSAMLDFLRREFVEEKNAGFPRIKRIPDMMAFRFVDYFASLDETEQSELEIALCEVGVGCFFPPNPATSIVPYDYPVLRRCHEGMFRLGGLKYTALRLLADIPGAFAAHGVAPIDWNHPVDVSQYTPLLKPAKAMTLRKLVKKAFAELCSPEVTNEGGGVWRYEGLKEDSSLRVVVDYGGWTNLKYWVTVQNTARPVWLRHVCFERLFGVGHGVWNCVTEYNAQESVDLLCEFVRYIAELPQRLPESYQAT